MHHPKSGVHFWLKRTIVMALPVAPSLYPCAHCLNQGFTEAIRQRKPFPSLQMATAYFQSHIEAHIPDWVETITDVVHHAISAAAIQAIAWDMDDGSSARPRPIAPTIVYYLNEAFLIHYLLDPEAMKPFLAILKGWDLVTAEHPPFDKEATDLRTILQRYKELAFELSSTDVANTALPLKEFQKRLKGIRQQFQARAKDLQFDDVLMHADGAIQEAGGTTGVSISKTLDTLMKGLPGNELLTALTASMPSSDPFVETGRLLYRQAIHVTPASVAYVVIYMKFLFTAKQFAVLREHIDPIEMFTAAYHVLASCQNGFPETTLDLCRCGVLLQPIAACATEKTFMDYTEQVLTKAELPALIPTVKSMYTRYKDAIEQNVHFIHKERAQATRQ